MLAKGQGPILIAGQTASGKSGLALKLAKEQGGIIINADSMQVYSELQILTARPSIEDMQGIPHRLYGHIQAITPYSIGQWLQDVKQALAEVDQLGKRAIIIGGTGLYFKGLLEGLSPVPHIPDDIRNKWRSQALDPAFDLHKQLYALDSAMANQLLPSDRQRLARALEVIESTGKSLLYWQTQPEKGLLDPDKVEKIMISIDRAKLYEKCDLRFDAMMQNGALAEVEELIRLKLPITLPAMRALGVRPLSAFIRGEMTKEDAIERSKTETRQYAKRQNTWLKSNMITWKVVNL